MVTVKMLTGCERQSPIVKVWNFVHPNIHPNLPPKDQDPIWQKDVSKLEKKQSQAN